MYGTSMHYPYCEDRNCSGCLPVLCRGESGCFHPVDWHTGPGTVAPGCGCCSWRKNEPQGRWIVGPLGLPMLQTEGAE